MAHHQTWAMKRFRAQDEADVEFQLTQGLKNKNKKSQLSSLQKCLIHLETLTIHKVDLLCVYSSRMEYTPLLFQTTVPAAEISCNRLA